MRLPLERGPLSRHVIESLSTPVAPHRPVAVGTEPIMDDDDAQLALWMLYELHYGGFEGVPDDREWDLALLELRQTLEHRFEGELRAGSARLLDAVPTDGEVSEQVFALVAADDSPSPAAYLQREASREELLDFLRERSVQQLKESDPQSFVLPRIGGAAKVALAEIQYDEYGGGRPERLHATLYADALEAAGLDRRPGAYLDQVSALSLASANVMSLFGLNRRLRGAAMGYLAAFEATSSAPSRRIAAGIERLGFPEAVAAYFHEHVEADAVHEHVAARDICGNLVAEEPTLLEDVRFGAAACLFVSGLCSAELLRRWSPDLEVAS